MRPWQRRRERARQKWQAVADWAKGPLPRIAVGGLILWSSIALSRRGRLDPFYGPTPALCAIALIATGIVRLSTHYPWRRENFSAAIWLFISLIAVIIFFFHPFGW